MTPDIFLSYTREDQATAQRFAEGFEAQGFKVWWDVTLRSGEAYDTVTEEALRTAKAVVVLWSKKSVTSRWVRAEATLADRNRTLVPATIEPCERPIMFELTQTADLSRWTGDVKDLAWRGFLADVRRFVEKDAAREPAVSASLAAAAKPSPRGSRPSIAILPFINRSGIAADDVIADGMAEDLTAAFSTSRYARVVAASATAVFRTGVRDLHQIGRQLGVRYLLEGNVRRVGEELRVTAQLVEAETCDVLWTHKFARPLAELASLQDELEAEIAGHFRGQVERAEMEHARNKGEDLTSEQSVLRAFQYTTVGVKSGYEAAVAEARRGVARYPEDGTAHANLAGFQGHLLHHRGGDDPELARETVESIRRARALDPNNPGVLLGIATALAWLRRPQEALPLAERAVGMNPDLENAQFILGSILARLGRSEPALAELAAAERLMRNSMNAGFNWKWRSVAHLQAGRLEAAREAAEQSLRLLPDTDAQMQSMLCLAKLDEWSAARDAMRRLREADPEVSCALVEGFVRDLYCGSNAAEEYSAIARRLWDETSSGAGPP
jgi:TolB-like protein